ncbi:MAG: HD domain-containing protein [Candidatus Micrarchaeota archaeon]
MFIKDAIFGNIELTPIESKLLDTPEMQRLRYVKQMGLAYLVYPGATHSRFEHSLGTMHITKVIAKEMGLEEEEVEMLAVAGLLHDVGHGPFSHVSDPILKKYLHTNHEEIGKKLTTKGKIKETLEENGLNTKDIIKRLSGKLNGEIVTASLGSDRLDYLLRDAYYTGVTYGIIDYQQIKSKMVLYRHHLAVYEQGLHPAESLLLARYFMSTAVYHHHAVVIANNMLEKAVRLAIENAELGIKEYPSLKDFELITKLTNSKASNRLIARLLERKLFKRIFVGSIEAAPEINEIENTIIKYSGLREDEFIVVKDKQKFLTEKIPVLNRNKKRLGNVEDLSPIIKNLEKEREDLIIASDRRNKEKILKAIKRLDIKVRKY